MKGLWRHRRGLAILAMGVVSVWFWDRYRTWREDRFDSMILSAASRYGVHPALVKAVVWQESRFDAQARGSKGEVGLMQLMPAAAGEWIQAEKLNPRAHEDFLDPGLNTQAGTYYLRKLSSRYLHTDNPLVFILADYNAGRSKVLKWAKGEATTNSQAFLAQMSYPGTRDYVLSVTKRYAHYRQSFAKP